MSAAAAGSDGSAAREERAALVALASVPGIGPATMQACREECGAASAWAALCSGKGEQVRAFALEAGRRRDPSLLAGWRSAAVALDPAAVLLRHEQAGQQVVAVGDPGYPARLVGDQAPPAVLFVEGSTDHLQRPTVAIVGTRNATRLGAETARRLALDLARRGVSVVSGLALGIDGAAHGAIAAGTEPGRPVGVVATGLERAYPRRHQLLHRQVATTGVLLSESPMGSKPLRWRFPARNRIIAGLSDAVVVVESRSAGGSMLTASEALKRDVPVLAVPGHPSDPSAAGALDLISDGAVPVRDVTDVLVAIGLGGLEPVEDQIRAVPLDEPSAVGCALLDDLASGPRTLAELIASQATELEVVSAELIELERSGHVTRTGAWFERTGILVGTRRVRDQR